jgi:hypothetical protein
MCNINNIKSPMKKSLLLFSLLALVSLFLSALPVKAAVGDVGFSVSGTAVSTNVSYGIVPIPPGGGQAKVTSLAGVTDNATLGFVWYDVGAPYAIQATNATTTNNFQITQRAADNITNDTIVILYQAAAGTYTRLSCTNATATNIICTSSSPAMLGVGDTIFLATPAATNLLASGTTTVYSGYGGILYGKQGRPLLVEVKGIGTNTVKLNWVSGDFVK